MRREGTSSWHLWVISGSGVACPLPLLLGCSCPSLACPTLIGHGLAPALNSLGLVSPQPPNPLPPPMAFSRPSETAAPCGWQSGILDLATGQLCGPGRVIALLSLSCHLCKRTVWGGEQTLCDSWDFFDDGCCGVLGGTALRVRRPGWAFVGPCLAEGLQEVMVPRWVSTPQSRTLKTPSMGVGSGGGGGGGPISSGVSCQRQGKVLSAGAAGPEVWGEEAIRTTVSLSAGIVAASFVNLGRCDCE